MTLNDLEWYSKIFNDTKRARPLCDSWASCVTWREFGHLPSTYLAHKVGVWRTRALCFAVHRLHTCSFRRRLMICLSTHTVAYYNLLSVKFIKHNQNYYLKLDVSTSIRGLRQNKLVLSFSGSWHNWKTPCQESSRMRGSVGSWPHTVHSL